MSSFPARRAVVQFAAAALVAGAALTTPTPAAAQFPLTVENCGRTLTFTKAPERIVSVGQTTTEVLLSLGLADRMVGTAVWFVPVLPRFEAENARIPRLADNDPSFEAVVGRSPDLVTAQFEWHIGPNGTVGTRDQFARLNIPTYIAPADCAKDNTGGGDGVRKELFAMEQVHRMIGDLARINGVEARGASVIAELRAREAAALASVAKRASADISVLFWFSSREVQGDAFVAGRNGTPAYIAQALGLRNVITVDDEWPQVGWETIVAARPDVIVIADLSRRRFAADDPAVKRRFLETDPVVSRLDAVRHGRIVTMSGQSMDPTIRVTDGIETLARALREFRLAE